MTIAWKMLFNLGSSLGAENYLSILIYHRVFPSKDPLRLDTPDAEQFAQQMRWVKRYFNVLPMHEAASLLRQGRLPKRALAITFDDGYIDLLDTLFCLGFGDYTGMGDWIVIGQPVDQLTVGSGVLRPGSGQIVD